MTFLATRSVNNEKDWHMEEEFSIDEAIQGNSRWQVLGREGMTRVLVKVTLKSFVSVQF